MANFFYPSEKKQLLAVSGLITAEDALLLINEKRNTDYFNLPTFKSLCKSLGLKFIREEKSKNPLKNYQNVKGKIVSEATKEKMRNAKRLPRNVDSIERGRQKLIEWHKHNKRTRSDAVKKKMSESRKAFLLKNISVENITD